MAMTQVLHINNISPFATKEQIQMLFSYVGRIEEFKIYPSDLSMGQNSQQLRFAYIKFEDERGVEVGQHLTNTVFLDRALTAMQSGVTALPGQRQLPPHISNQLQDMGEGQQMIMTVDPNLAALGLPAYPPLPPTTEPTKVEEIRRTVYIGNLPKGCDGEELLNFFNACIGEVMYLRMAAGNDYLPCDYAYVEFSQQSSVPLALQNSDSLEFQGHPLRIQHSKVAIIKPQRKTADQALEEVEEAIKSGNDGRTTTEIGRGYSPFHPGVSAPRAVPTSPRASVKRSSRSTSSSRSRRRRSRSTRSPSRSRRRRSKSPRERKRSRSRRRSRSRDKDRKKSSKRSRSRERAAKESGKSSKRDRDNRSKERGEKEKNSKKDKEREKERDRDREAVKEKKERKRSRSREKKREKDEEKSSKKSKKGSLGETQHSPKKAKREPHTPPSTRTNASEDAPSSMETATTPEKASATVKESTAPAVEHGEEESLRERLLERVKLKQMKSEED
uniref:RRM domain-containing protein n=1 Tax=Globodera rostochiensis TaxID=31243 RepID=A0A914HGU1_GLORO